VAWTIEYVNSAQKTVKKLSKQDRSRIRQFLEERLAPLDNPRQLGAALQVTSWAPIGAIASAIFGLSAISRTTGSWCW